MTILGPNMPYTPPRPKRRRGRIQGPAGRTHGRGLKGGATQTGRSEGEQRSGHTQPPWASWLPETGPTSHHLDVCDGFAHLWFHL